jgi:folate-binding protein YgfZ
MNNISLAFLQSVGASADAGGNASFANESAVFADLYSQNTFTPLSHCGLLEVRGPDAEKFLQGQLTCSSTEVSSTLSSPGAYCTVKGRVITSFQLLRPHSDVFWLRMRGDLLDIAARTLSKYIVFSKAKLALIESTIGIGLHGPNIASMLSDLIETLPAQQNGNVSYGGGLLIQRDAAATQYEYWGSAESASRLWSHCAAHCIAIGSRYWRWLQIRVADAEICAATSEMFLPHMLNYHETGAINFKKGCYTGQEIIARTHYRGQVKRHLLVAALNGPSPSPASAITDANGKAVGNVVDSVAIATDSAELLAVVADDSVDASALLRVGNAELRALASPYAIP